MMKKGKVIQGIIWSVVIIAGASLVYFMPYMFWTMRAVLMYGLMMVLFSRMAGEKGGCCGHSHGTCCGDGSGNCCKVDKENRISLQFENKEEA